MAAPCEGQPDGILLNRSPCRIRYIFRIKLFGYYVPAYHWLRRTDSSRACRSCTVHLPDVADCGMAAQGVQRTRSNIFWHIPRDEPRQYPNDRQGSESPKRRTGSLATQDISSVHQQKILALAPAHRWRRERNGLFFPSSPGRLQVVLYSDQWPATLP